MVGLGWGIWRLKEFPVLSRPLPYPRLPPPVWSQGCRENTNIST